MYIRYLPELKKRKDPDELGHEDNKGHGENPVKGRDRFSVSDMSQNFHHFESDKESKKAFTFYAPDGLYSFNTIVMGTASTQ